MDADAPILMTLAGFAYASPAYIAQYFAKNAVAGRLWDMVWIAQDQAVPVNFAYLVKERDSGHHVLAIRGTYPDPFSSAYWADGHQDSPFGDMPTWPFGGSGSAHVSAGTWTGFNGVLALTSAPLEPGGKGVALRDVLISLSAPRLTVTGHSLGGTLAPVVALWATTNATASAHIDVYAFAGMTPGDQGFADLLDGAPLTGRVQRYNNTLDTVPYGWDRVLDTRDFYTPNPRGGLLVEALLAATALRLALYGFASFGQEIPLPGTLKFGPGKQPCELVFYVLENLHQHMPDTYLSLLGAAPLPFSIGLGTVVTSKADPTVATSIGHALPVHHV